jgi:hypothetical protein
MVGAADAAAVRCIAGDEAMHVINTDIMPPSRARK